MLTAAELLVLASPPGWSWTRRPTLRTQGSLHFAGRGSDAGDRPYREYIEGFVAWARLNDLGLTPHATSTPAGYGRGSNAWTTFTVRANHPDLTEHVFGGRHYCTECGRKDVTGILGVCSGCAYGNRCCICNTFGLPTKQWTRPATDVVPRQPGGLWACAQCVAECESDACIGHGFRIVSESAEGSRCCRQCAPSFFCESCGERKLEANAEQVINRYGNITLKCAGCIERCRCQQCGAMSDQPSKLCVLCEAKLHEKDLAKLEKFDDDELPEGRNLIIPSTSFRPFRTISLEMEVNGSPNFIAQRLYNCGIISVPRVQNYSNRGDNNFVATLKHDGSVTGGELVLTKLNLDRAKHADAFLHVLGRVKGLVALKKAVHTKNCGGHIHIDAHNFSYTDSWWLLMVWNYLEDTIYRMAGAGCSYGHRSLGGENYAPGTMHKGPFGSKGVAGQALRGGRDGLNFSNFLQAMRNCSCGAMEAEDSKNCTCNLGMNTIEWRVWNSTSNPRILHGWVAFMQAMMAFASDRPEPTAADEAFYVSFPWTTQKWAYRTPKDVESTKERLTWIHAHLPLTEEERSSIVYGWKQSDFKNLGAGFLDSLLTLSPAADFESKKPVRNPARRQRAIRITPPSPGGGAAPTNPTLRRGHRLTGAAEIRFETPQYGRR